MRWEASYIFLSLFTEWLCIYLFFNYLYFIFYFLAKYRWKDAGAAPKSSLITRKSDRYFIFRFFISLQSCLFNEDQLDDVYQLIAAGSSGRRDTGNYQTNTTRISY